MCHLNILVRKCDYTITMKEASNLLGFMQSVTAQSYVKNTDGDGVYFNSGTLVRQLNKVNYFNFRKQTTVSNIILGHQRISTSGKEAKYTQPFKMEEFVLVHNGILSSFEGNEHSDTYNFFTEFVKEFNKCDNRWKRQRKVKYSLDTVLKRGGYYDSYSCGLLDLKTNELYYFKNKGRAITWYENENMLYLTTDSSNEKLIPLLKEQLVKIPVDDDVLYVIKPVVGGIDVEELGRINIKPAPKTEVYKTPQKTLDTQVEALRGMFGVENKVKIVKSTTWEMCEHCQMWTPYMIEDTGTFICELCMEEGLQKESDYPDDDWYMKLDD